MTDLVLNCKGDSKKLYTLVSKLTGSVKDNPLPSAENDENLANEFADYFMDKISKIRNSLSNVPDYCPGEADTSVPSLESFEPLSQDEVKAIISALGTKSCESDVIPTKLLKKCLSGLLPCITKKVNLSLSSGVFPSNYEETIVRPLLKKQGLEQQCSNYRPVSNLTFMSRVIEKAMLHHFDKHCDDHDLLPNNLSAYRPKFSCETALLRLTNDTLVGMEQKEVTPLLAIDLSAAFDTVNHNILLDVLQKRFGIKSTALNWVSSYLRPRTCKISVRKAYSSLRDLEFSVPEGSCSGPKFFLAYISTLCDIPHNEIDIFGFADDHILKNSFVPKIPEAEEEAIINLEKVSVEVKKWMDSNKFKMNCSKTEFIMFGSRQQLSKCSTKDININGDIIERVPVIRYLGTWLDHQLNLKVHISKKCQTAMINLQKIKFIRHFLTREATEILVLSLVMSHTLTTQTVYSMV